MPSPSIGILASSRRAAAGPIYQNNFETGLADATAITDANSTTAGAGTALDVDEVSVNSTITFSTTNPAPGSTRSARLAIGDSTGQVSLVMAIPSPLLLPILSWECLFKITTTFASTFNAFTIQTAAGASVMSLRMPTSREVGMLDANGINLIPFTPAVILAADTWYRFKGWVAPAGANIGRSRVEVSLASGGAALGIVTASVATYGSTPANRFFTGRTSGILPSGGVMYFDDIKLQERSNEAFVGA